MLNFLKFFAKIMCIVLLFIVIYGELQNYVFKKGTYFKSQWINALDSKNFDVVIIGNSRGALFELNDSLFNYMNLSEDASGLKTTYCQIYSFFKNNNSVKKVVLEYDIFSLRKINDFKRSSRWLPYFYDQEIYLTLKDEHEIFKIHKYLPAISYSVFKYDWNFASFINNLFNLRDSPWGERGYSYTCNNYRDHAPKGRLDYDTLQPNWFWIDKINDVVKNNNSELLLISSPYYDLENDYQSDLLFREKMAEKKLTFFDHSKIFLGNKEYFSDNRHLNCTGVKNYMPIVEDILLNKD